MQMGFEQVSPWILDYIQQQLSCIKPTSTNKESIEIDDRIRKLSDYPILQCELAHNINFMFGLKFSSLMVRNCYLTDIIMFSDFDNSIVSPKDYTEEEKKEIEDRPIAIGRITDGAVSLKCFITLSALKKHRQQYTRRVLSEISGFGFSQTQTQTQMEDDIDNFDIEDYPYLDLKKIIGARVSIKECKLHFNTLDYTAFFFPSFNKKDLMVNYLTNDSSTNTLGYTTFLIISEFLYYDNASNIPSFDRLLDADGTIQMSLARNIAMVSYLIAKDIGGQEISTRRLALGCDSQMPQYNDHDDQDLNKVSAPSNTIDESDFTMMKEDDFLYVFGRPYEKPFSITIADDSVSKINSGTVSENKSSSLFLSSQTGTGENESELIVKNGQKVLSKSNIIDRNSEENQTNSIDFNPKVLELLEIPSNDSFDEELYSSEKLVGSYIQAGAKTKQLNISQVSEIPKSSFESMEYISPTIQNVSQLCVSKSQDYLTEINNETGVSNLGSKNTTCSDYQDILADINNFSEPGEKVRNIRKSIHRPTFPANRITKSEELIDSTESIQVSYKSRSLCRICRITWTFLGFCENCIEKIQKLMLLDPYEQVGVNEDDFGIAWDSIVSILSTYAEPGNINLNVDPDSLRQNCIGNMVFACLRKSFILGKCESCKLCFPEIVKPLKVEKIRLIMIGSSDIDGISGCENADTMLCISQNCLSCEFKVQESIAPKQRSMSQSKNIEPLKSDDLDIISNVVPIFDSSEGEESLYSHSFTDEDDENDDTIEDASDIKSTESINNTSDSFLTSISALDMTIASKYPQETHMISRCSQQKYLKNSLLYTRNIDSLSMRAQTLKNLLPFPDIC